MNRKTILMLLEQLKRHEQSGKPALKPYKCPAGKMTIGWGHNYQDRPLIHDIMDYLQRNGSITRIMADRQLLRDVENAIEDAERRCKVFGQLDDIRQATIVNMVFNMGPGFLTPGRYYWPKFNECLNRLDYAGTASQMKASKWYRQLGGDPEGTDDGVLERSEELIDQMKTGKWKE